MEKEGDFRVVRFNKEGVARTSTEFEGASLMDNEYYFVKENGEKKAIPKEWIHFGPVSGSSTESGHFVAIEQIFIGTEEEFNQNQDPDYTKYIPKADPDRGVYDILIPEGYTGWVKIHTLPELNELPERSIKVKENGEAVFPYEGITLLPDYDHFYYIKNDMERREIPKKQISEIYNFPELMVFYVGPRETEEPFPYHEYLKEKNK